MRYNSDWLYHASGLCVCRVKWIQGRWCQRCVHASCTSVKKNTPKGPARVWGLLAKRSRYQGSLHVKMVSIPSMSTAHDQLTCKKYSSKGWKTIIGATSLALPIASSSVALELSHAGNGVEGGGYATAQEGFDVYRMSARAVRW